MKMCVRSALQLANFTSHAPNFIQENQKRYMTKRSKLIFNMCTPPITDRYFMKKPNLQVGCYIMQKWIERAY